ncbi:hypothetical protein RHI9324_00716 [Rhizobium sp. CECT 9324]|nr:hypothetical protein RHI9324_00716 [Rhizobium sp. CECT 9324]
MQPAKIAERGAGRSHINYFNRLLLAPCPRLPPSPEEEFRPVYWRGILKVLSDEEDVEPCGWKSKRGRSNSLAGSGQRQFAPLCRLRRHLPHTGGDHRDLGARERMVTLVQGRQNTDSQKFLVAPASFAQAIRLDERPATCRSPSLWGRCPAGQRGVLRGTTTDIRPPTTPRPASRPGPDDPVARHKTRRP